MNELPPPAAALDHVLAQLQIDREHAPGRDVGAGHVDREEVPTEALLVRAEEPVARVTLEEPTREAALVVLERERREDLRAHLPQPRLQQVEEPVGAPERRLAEPERERRLRRHGKERRLIAVSWHPQQQGGGWGAPPPAGPPAPFGQPPGQAPGQPPGPPPPGQGVDRSVVILVLGFSSLMALFIGCSFCGPVGLISLFLSVPAIVMARRDLRAIQAGQLPAHGRDATVVGLVVAIVDGDERADGDRDGRPDDPLRRPLRGRHPDEPVTPSAPRRGAMPHAPTRARRVRWAGTALAVNRDMQFQPVHTQWLLTLAAAWGIAFMFAAGLAGS
ncbi:MAG: hypothetical protein SangKO_005580 [Sandaracinaceae bacterium]